MSSATEIGPAYLHGKQQDVAAATIDLQHGRPQPHKPVFLRSSAAVDEAASSIKLYETTVVHIQITLQKVVPYKLPARA